VAARNVAKRLATVRHILEEYEVVEHTADGREELVAINEREERVAGNEHETNLSAAHDQAVRLDPVCNAVVGRRHIRSHSAIEPNLQACLDEREMAWQILWKRAQHSMEFGLDDPPAQRAAEVSSLPINESSPLTGQKLQPLLATEEKQCWKEAFEWDSPVAWPCSADTSLASPISEGASSFSSSAEVDCSFTPRRFDPLRMHS
jgi:hypothetical protein